MAPKPLLPCPFCGGEPQVCHCIAPRTKIEVWVECCVCGAMGPMVRGTEPQKITQLARRRWDGRAKFKPPPTKDAP